MEITTKQKIKRGLTSAIVPLIYMGLFIILSILWKLFSLPEPDEIFNFILNLFNTYGLIIVGLAAFIEGLVLVNIYFPGSAVILIGVVAKKDDPVGAMQVVIVTIIAFLLAAIVNYALGYFGLYTLIRKLGGGEWLKKAEGWYERSGHRAILTSFIHPNLGAFISVACGNARFPFTKFMLYAVVGALLWNTLWGVVVYNFANIMASAATQGWSVAALLLIWTMVAFVKGWRQHNSAIIPL